MVAVGTVAALEEEGDSVEVAVVMVAVGGEIVGLVQIDNGASYVVAMIDNRILSTSQLWLILRYAMSNTLDMTNRVAPA